MLLVSASGAVILDANRRACEVYGYLPSELQGRVTAEILRTPADCGRSVAEVLQSSRGSLPAGVVTSAGKLLPVEIVPSPVEYGGGHATLAVLIDVTARTVAERRAQRVSQRFQAMIEHSRDHIGLLTRDGISMYASPSTRTLLGYEPEVVVGTNVMDLIHPEDLPAAADALAACAVEPYSQATAEVRVVDADGDWRWMECVASNLLEHPAVGAIVVNSRDITQRRLLHAELAASEERYRRILETASEGIWTVDTEDRTTFVNRAMAEMLGYSVEEMTGTHPSELAAGDWPSLARMTARSSDPSARAQGDLEFIRRDGRPVQTVVCVAPLSGPSGNYAGAVATVMNVTERAQLERRMRHTEKMRAVGHLAGGIAHHFNNLLTIVIGSNHQLRKLLPPGHTGVPRLDSATRAAMRAASLTSQLLALGKQQVLYPEIIDLNDLLDRLAPSIRQTVGDRARIEIRTCATPAPIRADTAQIEHALLELVSNALDAMPDDGQLVFETEIIHRPGEPDCVVLRVRDSGRGIDRETQDRVFEPFFTTAHAGNRTGLGLAIVHSVMEQCGGTVHIDSARNHGTTVTLCFPQEASEQADHIASENLSILVVDDEAEVRCLVAEILSDSGYAVLAAKDGAEAVSVARSVPALDLLLTDVVMPGAPGPAVASNVKEIHPDVVVAYMSGYADEELVRQGMQTGESPLILKPFTPAVLENFLQTTYRARRG